MGNGKITKELKNLGLKINGTEPTGETVSEVINDMANDYQGGGTSYEAGNGISINDGTINADIKILEVSNITTLTTEQCNSLNAGDVVVKLTSNQKHTYTVSYKENNVGMCLTYVDASVSETVSYDFVEGNWVYNSTDVTPLGGSGNVSLYLADVYCDINGYYAHLTIQVDDNTLETYENLAEYLITKGCTSNNFYPLVGRDENSVAYLGIQGKYTDRAGYSLTLMSGSGSNIPIIEDISITYLGQENNEE